MAYVIKDPVPPMLANYAQASRFKWAVLNYMPRITIDGVECIGSMIYYQWKHRWYVDNKFYANTPTEQEIIDAEQVIVDKKAYYLNLYNYLDWEGIVSPTPEYFNEILKDKAYETAQNIITKASKYDRTKVVATTAHTKLYHAMGIEVEKWMESDHSQLEEAWFGFYAPKLDNVTITDQQIKDYITTYSPLIYPTHTDVFNPVHNACPVIPVTIPVTPCIFTDLNPDAYKVAIYETRVVTEAYTDVFGVIHPAVTEEVLVSGPQWDKMGWLTGVVTYHPLTGLHRTDNGYWANGEVYKTDAQVIAEINSLTGGRFAIHDVNEIGSTNRLTLLALLDTEQTTFQRGVVTVKRKVTYHNEYVWAETGGGDVRVAITTMEVSIKFRRIAAPSNALVAKMQLEVAKVEADRLTANIESINNSTMSETGPVALPLTPEQLMNKTLLNMGKTAQVMALYKKMVVDSNTALVQYANTSVLGGSTIVLGPNYGDSVGVDNEIKLNYGYYRVDAITAMHPIAVQALLGKAFTTDFRQYVKKDATFSLATLLKAGVAIGGIVVIAFFPPVAPVLAGLSPAAAAAAIAAYELAMATYVASTLAYYAIATSVMSVVLSRMGYISLAKSMTMTSQMYGMAASVYGVASIVNAGLKEAAKEGLWEMVKQKVTDTAVAIKDVILDPIGAVEKFIAQPIVSMGRQIISWLNTSFTVYANYINPPNAGLSDLAEELARLEKEVAESEVIRPDSIDTVNKELNDPYMNWMDLNEKMQQMPFQMTSGKNIELMSKYYDSGY